MATRKLTRAELIRVNELMKPHLKVLSDGVVEYEQGWSDEVVAKMISPDVNAHTIAGVRIDLYGKFVRTISGGFDTERMKRFECQIVALENGLKETISKLEALSVKHKRLTENLSVNRVIDVKHLA